MNKESLADKFAERIAEQTPPLPPQQVEQAQNVQPVQAQPAPMTGQVHPPHGQPIIKVMNVEVPTGHPEIIQARHEESVRNYPNVKVDEDEYVVIGLRRHGIGLFGIAAMTLFLFVAFVSSWILICFMPNNLNIPEAYIGNLSIFFATLTVLVLVSGYIGYWTYSANRFYVTNERAMQVISSSLLHQKTQVINLESVEDISFSRQGLLQHMLDYGTVRLSTTGDESTYTFHLARNPAKVAEILGEISENARENQPIPDEVYRAGNKLR